MLPGKKYTLEEMVRICLGRRWLILVPLALGIAAGLDFLDMRIMVMLFQPVENTKQQAAQQPGVPRGEQQHVEQGRHRLPDRDLVALHQLAPVNGIPSLVSGFGHQHLARLQ